MTGLESTLFYISTFGLASALVSYGIRKKIRIFAWLGLLIPILIGGFRYGVGTDYNNYIGIFKQYAQLDINEFIQENGLGEIAFFMLNKVAYSITGDVRLVFLVCTIITVTFFYLALIRLKVKYLGLVFFLFLLTIFPMTLNAVRQGVAISIVLYAMTFILDRSFWRYTLLVILAGLFHISALLVLPFYFVGRYVDVKRKQFNKEYILSKGRLLLRVLMIGLIAGLIALNVFTIVLSIPGFERYDLYLMYDDEGANYTFFVKLALLLLIVICARYTIFKGDYRLNSLLVMGATIEIVFLIVGFISPFIKREALYFSPFLIMLLPNFIDMFNTKGLRYAVYTAILLYGILFFIISYLVLGQSDIIPYDYNFLGGSGE